ncbi:spore coat putative kinase YutH [Alteribacillus bidgolensis]|uniref:Spore coat protein YutH n=1 Tax=Alteribacillus bidgolensis TaxID=930129 RepID=A0A1G8EIV9_9BACI|nr:spore coat protein YutH [Alteribacillus bidgolensis]SDH69807.1 spore coat protein YutH [Alteribacillus bidgolensis]
MMERNVYDHYGLYMDQSFKAGVYTGFSAGNSLYLLVPDIAQQQDDWKEKLEWAEQLRWLGDETIAVFVSPYTRGYSVPVDGEKQLLFHIPAPSSVNKRNADKEGKALAEFHKKGMNLFPRSIPQPFLERWCEWWETRLEQLENWYTYVRKKTNYSQMDKWFLQTFPYYIGRTENAIQWLKETSWNAEGIEEPGCVAHFCFTPTTWITLDQERAPVKLPSDWLYDHPSRDVSEWIRNAMENDRSESEIRHFIKEYEEANQITHLGRQLVFGRLLFPYYYMEQLEQTYLRENTGETEEALSKLQQLWANEAKRMEQLSSFNPSLLPKDREIPEWLNGSSFQKL